MKKKSWQVVEHKSGHDECCARVREKQKVTCVARIKTDRQENIVLRRLPAVAEADASALAAHRAALAR